MFAVWKFSHENSYIYPITLYVPDYTIVVFNMLSVVPYITLIYLSKGMMQGLAFLEGCY